MSLRPVPRPRASRGAKIVGPGPMPNAACAPLPDMRKPVATSSKIEHTVLAGQLGPRRLVSVGQPLCIGGI